MPSAESNGTSREPALELKGGVGSDSSGPLFKSAATATETEDAE